MYSQPPGRGRRLRCPAGPPRGEPSREIRRRADPQGLEGKVHVTLDLRLPDDDQGGLAEQLDKVLDCAVKTVEKEIDADAAEQKRELDVAPKEAAASQ